MSSIDLQTIRAYRETDYRVLGDPKFGLRIDVKSPALLDLYKRHGVASSAFFTACNPFSAALSEEENRGRQANLEAELRARKLLFLPGVGQHPSNGWPGEPSFLILGIELAIARRLGDEFDQNAIVWAGDDGVPTLVLLR